MEEKPWISITTALFVPRNRKTGLQSILHPQLQMAGGPHMAQEEFDHEFGIWVQSLRPSDGKCPDRIRHTDPSMQLVDKLRQPVAKRKVEYHEASIFLRPSEPFVVTR